MIPRLTLSESLPYEQQLYLEALAKTSFSGEIRTDFASRLVAATDNSIYQILPQAVLFPRSAQDIVTVLQLAHEERFRCIQLSPRGGGTGTNGQSLTAGIILDCSKYMNRILELNLTEGWVRVEPGVVLDQLNQHLKPQGFFFAPSLSPSNRATLGGMINTDACGEGSRVYGRTSNHVLELSCVFPDGTPWHSKPLHASELAELIQRQDTVGRIYSQADAIITPKRSLIEEQFPKMSRFLTGYNLAHVWTAEGKFNLNSLLCGSEGTLAVITEAKLKILPLPKFKQLIVVKYRSFNDALKAAAILVESDPTAIETVDEKILELAKGDIIYHKVKDFIRDEPHAETKTINLVEFTGDDAEKIERKVQALCQQISAQAQIPGESIGYYCTKLPEEITQLWNLRKKGVGLLGNTKGERKPIPFIEDTAVPPQNLAAYIQEFQALLSSHQLQYAMFGHIDVGCLHVRPALDTKNETDEALIRKLSDQVSALVRKHGGIMWAEHGRGLRSEYTSDFFGPELYQDLRRIKEAFDPYNQMNPGKIVTPFSLSDKVTKLDRAPMRGQWDRQILAAWRAEHATAVDCNGNGLCFNYNPKDVMCPSSKITRDRIHSPKGRAGIMREWLRQLSIVQQSPYVQIPKPASQAVLPASALSQVLQQALSWPIQIGYALRVFWQRFRHTQEKRKGVYDFSHEVYEAMHGCLACKACATECPVHVDIPELKSKFLEVYYTRYLRPWRDYLVGGLEFTLPWQSRMPKVINWVTHLPFVRWLFEYFVGLVDLPKLSEAPLHLGLQARQAPTLEPLQLKHLSQEVKERSVILLQDGFTSFYEAPLILETYDLLSYLGYRVYVAPFRPNGKPLHVKGFLHVFQKLARRNAQYLQELAATGLPIVGIDPSIVLTYRDEYLKSLGQRDLGFRVHLLQEWLVTQLPHLKTFAVPAEASLQPYQLLGHCTEKTAALASQTQWQQVFQALGLVLQPIQTGCCGMAGTYGHESEHHKESKGVYLLSWAEHIPAEFQQRGRVLVTGYSCRSQVKRFDRFVPFHPIQALWQELRKPPKVSLPASKESR